MEGRRIRRFGRRGAQKHNSDILPLHLGRSTLSNTLSCWYCDFKTSVFNGPLFWVGRNYFRFFQIWFSVGSGFSLTTMLGGFLILLWELVSLLHLCDENTWLDKVLSGSLFGIPSSVFGFGISVADIGYMCLSTIVAVCVHEFGHAFAAASEGVQIEYIAVFLAVLFPGALVAFNYDLLQTLPSIATLRIYCAGIWHNAVCCAFCGLILFMLPFILYPFYIHGESPMVLEVPTVSPLSGFLSPGDLITSLDGINVHNTQEWTKMAAHVSGQVLHKLNTSKNDNNDPVRVNMAKGYCVPNSMIEGSKNLQLRDDLDICPNGLSSFATITCSNSSSPYENVCCLIPKDIVKLKRCDDMVHSASNKSNCLCSEDETCLSPVQTRDSTWVEIAYSSPYNSECWEIVKNRSAGYKHPKLEEMGCGGAFVFIGDAVSMAHSVRLTLYRPRWPFYFGAYLPSVLEKLLVCTFHVSLALALLNSLPVYFLDGESILEATLSHLRLLSLRMQRRVLRVCLFGGTAICIIAFFRILFFFVIST